MSFYYGSSHHNNGLNSHSPQNGHHGGRSRRGPRPPSLNYAQKQLRPSKLSKEPIEAPSMIAFRRDFEAAKSFELEDDEMFCPFHLLTEDDLHSISSSASDRSSLSSGSPESSPLQHQLHPSPAFLLPPNSHTYSSSGYHSISQAKLHQPLAQRSRNAIPIVDPTTRAIASPSPSGSPVRQLQQHFSGRRW